MEEKPGRAVGSVSAWEVGVALFFIAVGSIVVWDSRRLGAAWGSDGPQAGYFPFYIGVIILIASVINLYEAVRPGKRDGRPFVLWEQLRMVLVVIVPSIVYVALIVNPWFNLGIYVSSALFIALFMRLLGKYGWLQTGAVAVGTMFVFFLMFEVWFKVPLPKGPLEAAFGYA